MSKGKIALLVSAVVLAVLMALLPKVIINKDKGGLGADGVAANRDQPAHDPNHEGHEDHATEPAAAPKDAHAAATPAQLKKIADLRSEFNQESNAQAKVKVADDLAQQYIAIARHDSAGYYYEQAAQVRPGERTFQKAGDQYFEAFTFAATEDRSKALAGKAQGVYEQVLKNNPANLDVKTNLAMTYISSDNPMKGITMLREVISADPKNEKALFNLGVLSMQSNQYDKAVDRFRELLVVNPGHVDGTFYLGVSLAETGKKQEAQKAFLRVKQLSKEPEVQASVDSYLEKLKASN